MKKKILAMLLIVSLAAAGCGSAPAATTPDKDLESSEGSDKSGKEMEEPETENQTDSQGKAGENGNEDLTEATDPQAGKDIAASGSTQTTSKNDNSSGSSGNTSSAVKPGNTGNNGSAGTGSAGTGSAGSGTGSAGAGTGTGGSSGAGSSGGSNGGGNTGTPSTPPKQDETPHVCNHNWVEITKTVNHEEIGHYESKVVKEAWDEAVYGYRDVCLGCGYISATTDEAILHCALCETGKGYTNRKIVVDTIHHEAEKKDVWVVDKLAWTEVVGTGKYKCSICGETK